MATKSALPSREEDFNDWYNTVVLQADMADYGPVRGTMIIKPYGWALWENIQAALDHRFKHAGVVNASFPMFIPMNLLQKEAQHVEGFSPELAVVTHGGGEELSEPLAVRPTSETLIGEAFARWIQSYRDLPLLINQWNSVVRWEMRTKLFLRTLEFNWQEGHTAHASFEEAQARTRQMLDIYYDFAVNEAAIPVIAGAKSELERFAGASETLTIEAMMGDGKALQSGTSHNFGQNFARAFDIRYLDHNNALQYCWTTSWGLSTRFIGAIIMVHGDDRGLVLPPRLAPYQVVIVPIFPRNDDKDTVMDATVRLQQALEEAAVRVKVDDRDNVSPGFKFNDWELRGVPVRLEIGPREVANDTVGLARRDMPGRGQKSTVSQNEAVERVQEILESIQRHLLKRATRFRDEHTHDVTNYDAFKQAASDGFVRAWWAGSNEDELAIKEETKATLRCFPLDQPGGTGTCFFTGETAERMAIFGRAY